MEKRFFIIAIIAFALASSMAYVAGSSRSSNDFFPDECEDWEDSPFEYEDESVILPIGGVNIDTSCGPSTMGYRMVGVPSIEGYDYYTCIYTGYVHDRCYWDHVQFPSYPLR